MNVKKCLSICHTIIGMVSEDESGLIIRGFI